MRVENMTTPELDTVRRENAELRAVAARNAERARRLARLRDITARLAASLDRAALFEEIVRAAGDLVASQGAALLLVDEGNEGNEGVVALRVETGQGLDHEIGVGAHMPLERTLANRALEARGVVAVENMAAEPDALIPSLSDGERPGALIVAPIRVEGRPFGVVEVYYAAPRMIPPDDVEMLDALSDAAAIALRNATAYARILEQGTELARRNEELARQQERLALLNDELRRANVLKSQFLSTMSHELRTPLTRIIGFGSLLLRGRKGESLSDRQRDNAERILSSARNLVTLINDILDLSRIEAGRLDIFRREVDLRELLDALRAELEPQAQARGLYMRVAVDSEPQRVVTDADRLRQVLTNLVGNAVKFTPQGGVTIRVTRAGESIIVAVQDTGVGIASDQQERIFDEFYQADQSNTRTAGGAGLGLTISRRLTALLGGRLTLSSTPHAGSTFSVILPATPQAHAIPGPATGSARMPAPGSGRVLVIDDDPEMVVLLERALEGSNYRVFGALSADEGVRKAHEVNPDAILLDVTMPETDGWRALHRLKRDPEIAHIPVVMHTIVADQALGFSLGATDYLVKPVEREQLLTALGRLRPVASGPILVVDDDENIRTLLSAILSEEHIPVAQAASGEEALRLVTQQLPRLIVLDLMMPGLDGFDVLRRLRAGAHTRHIPVVVVTAKSLTREEERLLSKEASMVITKNGLPLEQLLDQVRSVLETAL